MVKEVKNKGFEEINFYPLDLHDIDPPEIIVEPSYDSNFRITQIMRYNDFLNSEISKHSSSISSFKKLDWVFFYIEILLVILDVCIGTLGILKTEYISSTSSICIFITTFSTFFRSVTKKFMQTREKHQALLILSQSKLSQVSDKYNIALRDGVIDQEEYVKIVDEFKKYEILRKEIMNKLKLT